MHAATAGHVHTNTGGAGDTEHALKVPIQYLTPRDLTAVVPSFIQTSVQRVIAEVSHCGSRPPWYDGVSTRSATAEALGELSHLMDRGWSCEDLNRASPRMNSGHAQVRPPTSQDDSHSTDDSASPFR
jgi:hypothetical protein